MTAAPGPLDGLRVLELGTMYAAPTAGRMLRDFGAEVTKVEEPGTGDFARHWTPQKDGLSLGFARLNAGKRSTAVDLRRAEGGGSRAPAKTPKAVLAEKNKNTVQKLAA